MLVRGFAVRHGNEVSSSNVSRRAGPDPSRVESLLFAQVRARSVNAFTAHWRRAIVLRHHRRTADLSTRAPCRRWRPSGGSPVRALRCQRGRLARTVLAVPPPRTLRPAWRRTPGSHRSNGQWFLPLRCPTWTTVRLDHCLPSSRRSEPPVAVVLHGRGNNHASAFDRNYLGLDRFLAARVRAGGTPFALASVDGGETYWHERDGGEDAGAMVVDEFIPMLAEHGLDTRRVGFLGWWMGGYGALALAGRLGPARTVAVAAESPALWHDFADRPRRVQQPLRLQGRHRLRTTEHPGRDQGPHRLR